MLRRDTDKGLLIFYTAFIMICFLISFGAGVYLALSGEPYFPAIVPCWLMLLMMIDCRKQQRRWRG
jgi:hypothetical protein